MNKERKGSYVPRMNQASPKSWAQNIMNSGEVPVLPPTQMYRPNSFIPANHNDISKIRDERNFIEIMGNISSSSKVYGEPNFVGPNGSRYTLLSTVSSPDVQRVWNVDGGHREPEILSTPRRNMNETPHQENRGKRWSSEEDMYLLQQISFLSHTDIGRHLRRSENAVVSRLKKLAFHMIQNGEDPIIVQNNLHLKDEDIQQISNECFIYPKKTNGKFIISTKKSLKKGYFSPQQSQEVQLLLEIRTMLRKLLHISNDQEGSIRSPKRNDLSHEPRQAPIRISELNIEDLERRSEEFAKSNI